MDKLVTIGTYAYPEEAYLNQALLQSEDIQSYVFDDHILTLARVFNYAIGGVKIKVRECDAEDAIQILNNVQNTIVESPENNNEICPKCSSSNTRYEFFALRAIYFWWFLIWLLIYGGSSATFGIPAGFAYPFLKRRWKCKNCGFEFKADKN